VRVADWRVELGETVIVKIPKPDGVDRDGRAKSLHPQATLTSQIDFPSDTKVTHSDGSRVDLREGQLPSLHEDKSGLDQAAAHRSFGSPKFHPMHLVVEQDRNHQVRSAAGVAVAESCEPGEMRLVVGIEEVVAPLEPMPCGPGERFVRPRTRR
jgi:hypothetical protein